MNSHILEKNGDLYCTNHMEKVSILILDKEAPFEQTLLCQQCFEARSTVSIKTISFTKAKQLIIEEFNQKRQNKNSQLDSFFDKLQQFSLNLIQYKNQVIQSIDFMVDFVSEQRKLVKKFENKSDSIYNLLQERHYNINDNDQSIDQIKRFILNKLQIHFTNLSFTQGLQEFGLFIAENINPKRVIKIKEIKQDNVLIKPIYSLKQDEICHAIAFNKEGELMVAGIEQNIKVWELKNGKLINQQTLIGHTQLVNCLVFSQQINWFASGGSDSTIRGWKQQNQFWESDQPPKFHTEYISCLILTRNETQMISSSGDQTINIWKVDCLKNKIKYSYTLEQRHDEGISSMSLNQSENYLVSCGLDKTIVLWVKGYNEEWEYQNSIKVSEGSRICFISDTSIMFQPKKVNKSQIFEIVNNEIIYKKHLDVLLKDANDDLFLFPTIYNQKRQIIIQRHNRYVYIIKRLIDDTLKIIETIDCQNWQNCGSLVQNGEFLMIWNFQTKDFRLYQLFY